MALLEHLILPAPEKLFNKEKHYREHPVEFVQSVLGIKVWSKFAEFLNSIRDNKRTAAKGCYGSTKTFDLACACVWFVYCHYNSKVITTSPTHRQLITQLWPEIRSIINNARFRLGGRLLDERLKLGDNWFIEGFSARDYREADIAGWHADRVLLAIDEACGISPMVWELHRRICMSDDDRFAAIGNPIDALTEFAGAFQSDKFYQITFSAFDCPNVRAKETIIPGSVTWEWVKEAEEDFGKDSDWWQVKVLANFPDDRPRALIPLSWIEKAIQAGKQLDYAKLEGKKSLSVDIARYGGDSTVFAIRTDGEKHRAVHPTISYANLDLVEVADLIEAEYRERHCEIAIDAGGLGAGVSDDLKHRNISHIPVVGSSKTDRKDRTGKLRFKNMRSMLWWSLREVLDPKNEVTLSLPDENKLRRDLGAPDYQEGTDNTIIVEKKEDVMKKIGRSPDWGDAVAISQAHFNVSRGTILTMGNRRDMNYSIIGNSQRRKRLTGGGGQRLTGNNKRRLT